MSLRPLLALVLCFGLQTSLCTGGFLSVISGISDHFAYQADEVGLMSYGAIGNLTCENNVSSTKVGSVDASCGDASDCLIQAFHFAQTQSLLGLSTIDIFEFALVESPFALELPTIVPQQIARAGPLYEDGLHLSHTLLKRE